MRHAASGSVAAALDQAAALHRQGRFAEAEAIYRRVLAQHPDHPDALHLLGALAVQAGRAGEALPLIERAIAGRGDVTAYHNTLGLALRAAGDREGAAAAFARALALQPDNPEAHLNLGNLARDRDDAAAAIAQYRKAVELAPGHAGALNNLGNALRKAGQTAEAVQCLERAHQANPGDADILNNLAIALRADGRARAAIDRFEQALAFRPRHVGALAGLGSLLAQRNRPEEAVRRLQQAVALDPSLDDARYDMVGSLSHLGRSEEARAMLDDMVTRNPDAVRYRVKLGDVLRALNRIDDAKRHYARAIEIDPDCAAALAEMAMLEKAELAPAALDRIERLLRRPDIASGDRSRLHFAMARVHDAKGEYDAAFAHLEQANAGRRRELASGERGFDLADTRRQIDELVATFDRALFARTAGFGDPSDLPMFVVGMPRSGTTLTEQILASHSEVHGAGELRELQAIIARLEETGGARYPRCMRTLDRAETRRLARGHIEWLARLAPGKCRVIDKEVLKFGSLGPIAVLFPGAKIIHCRRHPLDNGLSCFEQDFLGNWPWIWDLATIGQFYREYRRLMDHWREVLPVAILDVAYEDLVADTPRVAREMVRFCGLDWEDACLAFHESGRPVLTASKEQVRRPIYSSSVGKWRRYERHLGPLIEALEQDRFILNHDDSI